MWRREEKQIPSQFSFSYLIERDPVKIGDNSI